MEDQNVFYPGDVVRILDKIDGESTIVATVKAIEEDDDKVVALVDSIEKPSEYFTPNKVL